MARYTYKDFIHLHVHDYYSLLDGFGSPERHAKRAKELGMTHLSATNHSHIGGSLDFYKSCQKEGITPILGLEAYWTEDMKTLSLPAKERTELAIKKAEADGVEVPAKAKKKDIEEFIAPYEYDTKQYHLILIAKNQKGWSNLINLQSIASDECTYNGRYVMDNNLLREYSEGIICSSACIGNYAANLINRGEVAKAELVIDEWHNIYGDDFYLEIQPLNLDKQWKVNMQYIEWSKKKGIKLISSNDVHYTMYEDHDDHDTLMCIGMGKVKSDPNRMKYNNEFWLRSADEMIEAYEKQHAFFGGDIIELEEYMEVIKESMTNTMLVADKVEDIKLGSDVDVFPEIDIPFGLTPEEYLTKMCFENLYAYKLKNPEIDVKEYEARLHEELHVINSKGYAPYFIVYEDLVTWANQNNVPSGPGRGSAAGSLVTYVLGITRIIDPIKHDLLFFRFLTMDRTSPPDIDSPPGRVA